MGCIEIFINWRSVRHHCMFNRNMGCIEIDGTWQVPPDTQTFNRNMGCIEMPLKKSRVTKQLCLIETWDVLK